MTEERTSYTFRMKDGYEVYVPAHVAADHCIDSRERLAAMPRSVLECLVPPLPRRMARAINVGGGGEVER